MPVTAVISCARIQPLLAVVTAMRRVFAEIRADGGIHNVDKHIVSVEEVFELQRAADMKATEQKYLR
jgi:hypothetical protein